MQHKIQMVDLKRQYLKIKDEVDAAIANVIDNTAFINGPEVKSFSGELAAYLGVKHVIPCANGTEAIQIALMALGLQPGDEVITPSFTFIATVEAVALLGIKPVFIDVDEKTFNIDPDKLRALITPKVKAIIPVHLYGQAAPMEEISAIAKEYGLHIIEDCAQAIGGHYTFGDGSTAKNGTIGDIGCTSFFPSKNLGAYGDGGAIFTNNDALAEKISMIVNHGSKNRYYHEIVGCNSRLDSIQAAVLRIKLRLLDDYCSARRNAAEHYDKELSVHPRIHTPYRTSYAYHVFHQYTLTFDTKVNRDAVKQSLEAKGVPSMIYYPVPCHRQQMFAAFGGAEYHLPVTDSLTPSVLSLPIHTELTGEELKYITDSVLEAVEA